MRTWKYNRRREIALYFIGKDIPYFPCLLLLKLVLYCMILLPLSSTRLIYVYCSRCLS
jgi:hypothetical protein